MTTTAQITLGQAREQAFALLRQGRRYEFLRLAEELLARCDQDVQLRLQAAAQYASLGLLGIARGLAAGLPAAMRAQPDVARMMDQLAAGPTGRVDFAALRPRFERNLRVLDQRGSPTEPIREAWKQVAPSLELYRCTDGNYQIRLVAGGSGRWVMGLADHRRTAAEAEIPTDAPDAMPFPYLFEGVGFGWLLQRVHKQTAHTFLNYSPAIYIVEPAPAALAAVLHLHDLEEVLADERVFVFTGPQAADHLAALLRANEQYPLPHHKFRMPAWDPARRIELDGLIRTLSDERLEEHRRLRGQVEAIYRQRDRAWWAERFKRGLAEGGLRVLCPVSRFTTFLRHSMEDVANTFRRLGHQVMTISEQTDFAKIPTLTYLRSLRDFQPDLVFVIDHLRYEYANAFVPNVPFVAWIQDRMGNLFCSRAGASIGPLDFVMGCGFLECVNEWGYPAEQFLPCLVPTNAERYSGEPLPEQELAPYRCDVSYVSHHSEPPAEFHRQQRQRAKRYPRLCVVMDELYERFMDRAQAGPLTDEQLRQLVREVEQAHPDGVPSAEARDYLFAEYLAVLNERVYRHAALEWAAQWAEATGRRFCLYGRGWDKHPTLAPYARGTVENGHELRCVYQASAINLHMSTYGTLHQRLLDGLAAGGFFLVRYHPSDFVHEAFRLLTAYVRDKQITRPTEVPFEELPAELADLLRQADARRGRTDRRERFAITRAKLDRIAHVSRLGHELAAAGVLPHFERIVFHDAASFASLADHFLACQDERRRLATEMRDVVLAKFTYEATIRRVLEFVLARLQEPHEEPARRAVPLPRRRAAAPRMNTSR